MIICLQSGHEGVTTGATGAPGEKELNVRIRNRLSDILIAKGFVVQLVNAYPTDAEINKDYSLFLALHGDANVYGTGGGCIGSGDKSVDNSWVESARIRDAVASEYFSRSGIVNHPERVNVNMTKYYMWARTTSKTPCVLLEMGVVQDAHDKVILADTERVATAIARGVCKAFNVAYDVPAPGAPMVTITKDEYNGLKAQISSLSGTVVSLTSRVALMDGECQVKLSAQKKDLINKVVQLASNFKEVKYGQF